MLTCLEQLFHNHANMLSEQPFWNYANILLEQPFHNYDIVLKTLFQKYKKIMYCGFMILEWRGVLHPFVVFFSVYAFFLGVVDNGGVCVAMEVGHIGVGWRVVY